MRVGIAALAAALLVPFQTVSADAAASLLGAETTITEATTNIAGHTALCLSRMTTQDENPNSEFSVLVPIGQVEELKARGFDLTPCGTQVATFAAYKASVCKMALGNNAVQAQFEQALGVSGRLLCAYAKALSPDDTSVTVD